MKSADRKPSLASPRSSAPSNTRSDGVATPVYRAENSPMGTALEGRLRSSAGRTLTPPAEARTSQGPALGGNRGSSMLIVASPSTVG